MRIGRTFVRLGVIAGNGLHRPDGSPPATGSPQHRPPPALDAGRMEGLFHNRTGRPVASSASGPRERRLDNPLTFQRAELPHLSALEGGGEGPRRLSPDTWPDNIPLLYYGYHIMVGLGTIFIAVMALASLNLWRGALYRSRPVLWLAHADVAVPYIATPRVDHTETGASVAGLWNAANRRGSSPHISPATPCSR